MKTESMKITFDGQSHQIDSNTLINTLIHYNAIIAEANRELSDGERNVQVNINALREGSFEINISLAETLGSLFSGTTVAYLSGLITIVGAVFKIYKHFKGRPVRKDEIDDDFVEIKIDGITIKNITNVYNTPLVREAISKSIETANSDANVEGITVTTEELPPIKFNKSEFADLIYSDFDMEEERPEEIDEYVDANLVVTGLKFEKGGKWEFIYDGFKISMIVKDDALMQEIDNGARFGKGDSIKVRMKIVKRFNQTYNAYENKGYKIVEFYEHIVNKKPKQGDLFKKPN